AVTAPSLQAAAGTGLLALAYGSDAFQVGVIWLSWWAGDASGILLVVPLMLSWLRGEPVTGRRSFWIHAVLGGGLAAAVTWLVLCSRAMILPLAWLVFPALIWAALMTGVRGTSLVLWPMALVALGAATSETGALAARLPFEPIAVRL